MLDDLNINILINTSLESVVTEFYIYDRQLNISLAFFQQNSSFLFKKPLDEFLYIILFSKLHKRYLQKISLNYSSNIEYDGFMEICTK